MQTTHAAFKTLCAGFSKLSRGERLARLHAADLLTEADLTLLTQSVDTAIVDINDRFVENVIGCFPMPLGVATNFTIDGRDYIIPMVVEETSIIAAASRTARWVRTAGKLYTEIQGDCIIGQIQVTSIRDFSLFKAILDTHKTTLIEATNHTAVPNLVKRKGGVKDLVIRKLYSKAGVTTAVVHVLLDPCESMGANAVTQACEYLKTPIQRLTGATPKMAIVSNLTDTKLTRATVVLDDIDATLADNIEEASRFAEIDPYRAATHNKGVLNGIDPILIATGNDWRAVEANIHAYAARSGQYSAITQWRREGRRLVGHFEAPITVGIVGGVTTLHPMAQFCLRLLNVGSANQLSRITAAVGLVQNLGALYALTGKGIIQGHMKLHINNLILAADAKPHEEAPLRSTLEALLKKQNKLSLSDAQICLQKIRDKKITHEFV